MIGTSDVVKAAESILAQAQRDCDSAVKLIPYGVSEKVMPFAWQGNIIRGATVAKMWRAEGRQTLAMHPEVVREIRMATSSKFPLEMLRTIPYLNPMVVFGEPPVIPSWRFNEVPVEGMEYQETDMRLMGFLLHGRVLDDEGHLEFGFDTAKEAVEFVINDVTTTHNPAAKGLGMVIFFEILDAFGNKIDTEVASFSVPLFGITTLGELVNRQADRFAFSSGMQADRSRNVKREKWIKEVYKIVMGTMLYLCSTTLDAEKVPAGATKRLARTIARKPLNLYRVGWTLGTALTKYRQERDRANPTQAGDIRHQQDPQHRKAHFRMQWYGPRAAHACERMRNTCFCDGRHREWIFIAPYWTHRERLGETGVNTVRRVPLTG